MPSHVWTEPWVPHRVTATCCCIRCLWRRHFATWWAALESWHVHVACIDALNMDAGLPSFGSGLHEVSDAQPYRSPSPSPTASEERRAGAYFLAASSAGDAGSSIIPETMLMRDTSTLVVPGSPSSQPESAVPAVPQDSSSSQPLEDAGPETSSDAPAHKGWTYDTAAVDGKILFTCNWDVQTPQAIWDLLTSEGHGTATRAGMTTFFRHVVKFLSSNTIIKSQDKEFCVLVLQQQKGLDARKAKVNTAFRSHFLQAAADDDAGIRLCCRKYNASNPVYWHHRKAAQAKDTLNTELLPAHSDIDAWCRLIILLVHADAQALWSAAANPSTNREAHDNPDLGLTQYTEKVEQKIMDDYFNHISFTAPHTVNLAPYAVRIQIDASKPPAQPKSVVWMRDVRQKLRRLISACTKGFNVSGSNQQGLANVDADTRFWVFCHGDTLVMFMWLAWCRGQGLPAHCTIALPPQDQMDVGVGGRRLLQSPASPSKSSRMNEDLQFFKRQLEAGQQQTAALLDILKSPPASASDTSSVTTSSVAVPPPLDCLQHALVARNLTDYYPCMYRALGVRSLTSYACLTVDEVKETLSNKTEMPLLQRKQFAEVCEYAHKITKKQQ
jgi:hypothetical protein